MAYSNTYNQTKVSVDQLISYAYRKAGKAAEEVTPEYSQAAKQALFYILQNSVNRGMNLWYLENLVVGAQTNEQWLTLPPNVVDVKEANWVYIVNPQITAPLPLDNPDVYKLFDQQANDTLQLYATTTLAENYFGASYSQATRLFYIGFNAYSPGAPTTYSLDYEVSNDGVTWTVWESFPDTTLVDFQWAYFTINATQEFNFYRLKNRNTTTTYSLRAVQFAQSQQVIPLARLNIDDYWNLPNKQFQSVRSLQYWFDRKIDPRMYLWPVPNNNYQVFQLIVELQPQDVGSLSDNLYLPDRVVPYIQAALAHELSMQLPGVDMGRVGYLEQQALSLRQQFEEEDRDKSPIYFTPNVSYYTL